MSMERFEIGMLAKSKAGHDKGHVYIIVETDSTCVYLVDGKIRTLDKPKKKKKKHVQLIAEKHEIAGLDDVGVKRILKLFDKDLGRK